MVSKQYEFMGDCSFSFSFVITHSMQPQAQLLESQSWSNLYTVAERHRHSRTSAILNLASTLALTTFSVFVVIADGDEISNLFGFCIITLLIGLGQLILNTFPPFFFIRKQRDHARLDQSKGLAAPLCGATESGDVGQEETSEEADTELASREEQRPMHRPRACTVVYLHVTTGISVCVLFTLLVVFLAFIDIDDTDSQLDQQAWPQVLFSLFTSFNIATQGYALYSLGLHRWTSPSQRAKFGLLISNAYLLITAAALVATNQMFESYSVTLRARTHDTTIPSWAFRMMFVLGLVETLFAIAGFVVTGISFSSLGSKFLSSVTLPLPYLVAMWLVQTLAIILGLLALLISFHAFRKGRTDLGVACMRTNTLLTGGMILCTAFAKRAYTQLTNPRLPSGYEVEELDLDDPRVREMAEREGWFDRINLSSGTKHVGAWDGRSTLSLMRTYHRALNRDNAVPNISAVCLRVYKEEPEQCRGRSQEPNDPDKKDEKSMHTVAIVFITVCERFDLSSYVKGCCGSCLSCAFGAQSRLPILTMRFGLVGFQWPFHSGVFLAHRRVPSGKISRGQEARVAPDSKGVADAKEAMRGDDTNAEIQDISVPLRRKHTTTRVLKAIVEWNDSKGHCRVLFIPSLVTQVEPYCFEDAAFLDLPLAPTAIADLRPHRGLSYREFMRRALKKGDRRDHEAYAERKGGSVHIHSNLSRTGPNTLMRLWANVATGRRNRGDAATLVRPTPSLFTAISQTHEPQCRKVFALCDSGGDAVASAILFQFPGSNLVTSDMQGMDHARARPLHAYFAMLQRAVRLGLESGSSFVDFGPTTLKPKLDAGCKLVEMRGGYHTRNLFLRSALKSGVDSYNETAVASDCGRKSEGESLDASAESVAKARAGNYFMSFCEEDFQQFCADFRSTYGVLRKHPPSPPQPEAKREHKKTRAKKRRKRKTKKKAHGTRGTQTSKGNPPLKPGQCINSTSTSPKVIVNVWWNGQDRVWWARVRSHGSEYNCEVSQLVPSKENHT